MEIVADGLNRWKPDGIRGFEDCKGLFEQAFDSPNRSGTRTTIRGCGRRGQMDRVERPRALSPD